MDFKTNSSIKLLCEVYFVYNLNQLKMLNLFILYFKELYTLLYNFIDNQNLTSAKPEGSR